MTVARSLNDRLARHWPAAMVLLVLLTLLIRARYFGNPLIDADEEFYLLTGDRLLHGAVPYLDIWDRKPVGLFLLYAGIRLLGGDGILQYQIVASLFAGATTIVIAQLARRIAPPGAALVAAIAYVPALAMNGGQGGQTPVFYNLPMALAAWLLLSLAAPPSGRRPDAATVRRRGLGAMLLVGIALQIKYSALFEGMFFGLALLWLGWRASPRAGPRALDGLLWVAAALAPTALATLWYWHHGALDAFVYANFTSILARGPQLAGNARADFVKILVRLTIFVVPILCSEAFARLRPGAWTSLPAGRRAHAFLLGWLAAALFGFAVFGTYFNHYALPLLPPLAIAAAPAFAIRRGAIGAVLAAAVLLALGIAYPRDARKYERRYGDAAWAQRLVAQIAPRLHGRCLYVFYGDPILYHLTGSCLPTRWVFPYHLNLTREAPALGVDPVAEARRIMAAAPQLVLDRIVDNEELNPAVVATVRGALRRNYRLVWSGVRANGDLDQIWEWAPRPRPLSPPAPPAPR